MAVSILGIARSAVVGGMGIAKGEWWPAASTVRDALGRGLHRGSSNTGIRARKTHSSVFNMTPRERHQYFADHDMIEAAAYSLYHPEIFGSSVDAELDGLRWASSNLRFLYKVNTLSREIAYPGDVVEVSEVVVETNSADDALVFGVSVVGVDAAES